MCKITRICDICGKDTEYQDLLKDIRKKDGVRPRCNACETARKIDNGHAAKNRIHMNKLYRGSEDYRVDRRKKVKEYRTLNKEAVLLSHAKIRAKRKGTEFTIDKSDIIIPEYCPILNIRLDGTNIARRWNSPSLDRIDNTKSYIKGNVRVISYMANTMKTNATLDELRLFAKNIGSYIGDDDIVQTVEKGKSTEL